MGKGEEEDGNAPLNVSVNLKPLYKKKKKKSMIITAITTTKNNWGKGD